MNGSVAAPRARWILAFIFTLFLLLNVVIISMVLTAVFEHDLVRLIHLVLNENAAMGLRVGLVLLAAIVAYFLAQQLYRLLVRENVPASEAVSPSMGLLSYLVLIIAAYGFLGLGSWIWLPVLFLLVLLWTVISLWSLLGWLFMTVILLIAVFGGVLTYLLSK